MDAELFEERAILKIGTPVRIEGIGRTLDLTVSVDFDIDWIDQSKPCHFTVRRALLQWRRKFPFASQGVPILSEHPRARLFRVSTFGPMPETLP